jgi:hypothetical protein
MLTHEGLLRHWMVLHQRPGLYSATREGLQWHGLGRLPVFSAKPFLYEHDWHMAAVAVALHLGLPGWDSIYEREIRRVEIDEGKLIASSQIGGGKSRSRFHRPDMALVSPSRRVVAIEAELTDKHSPRLNDICRAWAWARHVDHVYYLAPPKVARAVTRAVETVEAQDKITVLDLEDVAGVAERELAKESAVDTQETRIKEEVL